MLNPNLPEEILIEIFSRLPAKSVGKCRCLSKSWRSNLSTSQFINSQLTRKTNQNDFVLILEGMSVYPIGTSLADKDTLVSKKLDFPDEIYKVNQVLCSCNGLVLFWTDEDDVVVVNPLTLLQVCIKNTPLDDVDEDTALDLYIGNCFGLGYDSICDDYKIVKISQVIEGASLFVDVYSMKHKFWKRLHDITFDFNLGEGIFVNGCIHWLAAKKDGHYVIAAFDVATESFHSIPVPSENFQGCPDYKLLENRGCLFIVYRCQLSTKDAWVMREYGEVNSWTKCQTKRPRVCDDGYFYYPNPLCAFGDDEIVLASYDTHGSLIVWKVADGTAKHVTVDWNLHYYILAGCTIVYSLVSPIQYGVAS